MKILSINLLAGAAALALSAAPFATAHADPGDAPAMAADHGNWTLKQREEWLHNRLDKARDEKSIDHHEFDRVAHDLHGIREDEEKMRDHHDGQLTDNETADLEGRLDEVAAKIHWLHENSFQRPW